MLKIFSFFPEDYYLFREAESTYNQFSSQDPATPLAEGILDIHGYVLCLLLIVFVFVSYLIARILYSFGVQPNITQYFSN
jgi:hypothetical protein